MEQAYFYGAGLLLQSRPISMEQAYFYAAGPSQWSRPTSMQQAHFSEAGLLLWSRPISTELANFQGQAFMQERYFCGVGLFMWSRPSFKRVYLLLKKLRRVPCGPPYLYDASVCAQKTCAKCKPFLCIMYIQPLCLTRDLIYRFTALPQLICFSEIFGTRIRICP